MKWICITCLLILNLQASAQGIFEDAVGDDFQISGTSAENSYELNGYIRGVFFAGKIPDEDKAEMKSGFGEASLKLRVRKKDFGDAFAELRFQRGHEFGEQIDKVDIREAYVNIYAGRFDFRVGEQIVVWGRADGFNPTDNITPKDMFARSPDEDDKRKGNFLIRSHYNLPLFRFEAIWAPFYRASVIPSRITPLPSYMMLTDYPDASFGNNSLAMKLNLELASLDGSISYFNGYNPSPGISIDSTNIISRAYRMHVLGADFSTTVMNNIGLRGEFAYRKPHDDHEKFIHIPNPDLQYTIGLDRELASDFTVIMQYIGRYVFDYTDMSAPTDSSEIPAYEIALKNRMIASQTDEISHSISFRPAWKLMHETLTLEILGLYKITTEEFFIKPQTSYDIADALTLTIGGELYSGQDETLFGIIDENLSSVFMEIKASF